MIDHLYISRKIYNTLRNYYDKVSPLKTKTISTTKNFTNNPKSCYSVLVLPKKGHTFEIWQLSLTSSFTERVKVNKPIYGKHMLLFLLLRRTWLTPSMFASLALVDGLLSAIILMVSSPHTAYLQRGTWQTDN